MHSYATPPLAQLCKPLKEKKKNSPPTARARAGGALALDQHGITHRLGDARDSEALLKISQHTHQSIEAAAGMARQADPLGRAWPSKVLRLLTPESPAPRQSAQATPAWAACADWLN